MIANGPGLIDKCRGYRASKGTLFWAVVAAIVLTLIVGFTWGGWVTGGTATAMANEAANNARAQLAATVCVNRFLSASDANTKLVSLKDTNVWERESFLEKGGWATPPGFDKPIEDAADLCADQLVKTEMPLGKNTVQNTESAPVAK